MSISLNQSLEILRSRKKLWAALPVSRKTGLLLEIRRRLGQCAPAWVEASVRAKGIDAGSPWAGEEWITGPLALALAINGYLDSLAAISRGRLPPLKKVYTRPNGQVVARVFPNNLFDSLLLNGITTDVWMDKSVAESGLGDHMASFYKEKDPPGKVALVLGAGNLTCIAPYDALYRLYARGEVVLLKINPIHDYLLPLLLKVFEPLVNEGFLQVTTGGPDAGQSLVLHEAVEAVHLTGSSRTLDTIVFGPGPEGELRKREKRPLLAKPVTGETGGVSPLIILPGPWSKADIRFQAENAVSMKLHNSGFNCVAPQVLVLPRQWPQKEAFLDAIREVLRELPPRQAWYPGAAERQAEAVRQYPSAELFENSLPRTLITAIDPDGENEYAFSTEFFGPVLAQTSLPGESASEYLKNAVRFCNEKLAGSLGATLIGHPATIRGLGPALEEAIAGLRYGSVGVNVWNATTFLLPQATWGPWLDPAGNHLKNGAGVTHNTFLFDRAEKSVCTGSFYPFPRGFRNGSFSLLPKPPWFVTNRTAHFTAARMTGFAVDPGWRHLPGIFWSAIRG